MSEAVVNVNGVITDEAHAVVRVFDHGFLYGEGVYETLRTYRGRPFLLEKHLKRLRSSADFISLSCPVSDGDLAKRIDDTIAAAEIGAGAGRPQFPEWYIRVILTRGVGDLTYDPSACPTPTMVIIVKPHVEPAEELYSKGVKVVISSVLRNHPGTVNPLIKSNNLLNNALAMQEGFKRGAFEVLMRNYKGELAECALSNFFIVKNGEARTPPLDAGLLAGITREFVWDVGKAAGVPVREATIRDEDLFGADEAFLTGTTRGIMPIVEVDGRPIGTGVPGPVTKRLMQAFAALVSR